MSKVSEIKIRVHLDEQQVPEKMEWQSDETPEQWNENSGLIFSVWNPQEQSAMRIDLWTKDMRVDEMNYFVFQTIMTLADAPWPGLTPDLLSVLLVVATQARGSVLFHQKMFESRLFFVDKLIDMGAQIILCDPHRAVVVGHDHKIKLRAGRMTSPDIRAGIALLIEIGRASCRERV